MTKIKFIFFKKVNCKISNEYFCSKKWADLTIDKELKKIINFEVYEYDNNSKNKRDHLEENYKFVSKYTSPYFAIETKDKIYAIGNLKKSKDSSYIKEAIIHTLKSYQII